MGSISYMYVYNAHGSDTYEWKMWDTINSDSTNDISCLFSIFPRDVILCYSFLNVHMNYFLYDSMWINIFILAFFFRFYYVLCKFYIFQFKDYLFQLCTIWSNFAYGNKFEFLINHE